MRHITRTSLILLCLILSFNVLAQENNSRSRNSNAIEEEENLDSNKTKNDSIFNTGKLEEVKRYPFFPQYIGLRKVSTIDSTLSNIDLYNPGKQDQSFSQDLGIIGSASMPLILDFKPQVSSNIGINSFDLFIRDISEVEIIETSSPFTQLSYVMGAKKENVLRVQHAQSFLDKQIKAGIDFKLFNAIGYYLRQKTDIKNFNGNLSYQTKDRRYSVESVYFHNKLIVQENGGIIYDSIYEQNLQPSRQIISVNLSDAENFIKYSGLGITQTIFVSKAEPDYSAIPDTNTLRLKGYSVYHYKKPYFDPITPLGRFSHTFLYTKENYTYSDNDGSSSFYSELAEFPENVNSTFDSINHRKIENIISYSNFDYKDNLIKPKFLTYSFGIGIVSNRFTQDTITNTLTELNPQAELQLFLTKNLSIRGTGIYSYRSDNSSAYNLKGIMEASLKKNELQISFNSLSSQAPWIYQNFYSNYFQWNNEFQNQKFQELDLIYKRPLTQIRLKSGLIHDYLYFNQSVEPTQYNEALTYFNIALSQGVRLGNFGFDFNFIYQGVSNSDILRVPKFYSNTKLFYTNTLFKSALELQLGFNVRYFSKYYANNYMPALRSFYLQDEREFGNYPYIDLFVNAKIKRARLFFKYKQLNSSFMPMNYFSGPHYPNADASATFGVIWQLFN